MKNSKVMIRIFKLCKEFKIKILILLLTLILTSFFSTYPIKYIEKVINICTNYEGNNKTTAFFIASITYLALHILNVFFRALFEYLNVHLETKIGHKIRMSLFSKLQKVPVSFYDSRNSSDLTLRLVQDSSITVDGILKPVTFIIKDILVFILGFYYMAKIDLEITLIMIPIGIFLSAFAIKTGPKIRKLSENERDSNSILWQKFTEYIKAIKEMKAYCQENKCLDDVCKNSLNTNEKIVNLKKYIIITSNINSAFFMGIIAFIMILGGYKVSIGTLSIGGLTALMMYNGLLVDPMLNFFTFYQEMQRVLVSVTRIFSILEEPDEEEKEFLQNKFVFNNSLDVNNIMFKYKDKNTLNNISLSIRKGQKIAFVGHSGSGKSTICKLLIRFYDVEKGEIKIDNVDVNDIKLKELRSLFGIVFQDAFLFSGTLRENLMFANPDATDKELDNAVRISGVNLFLENLPDKLDTFIGENGLSLSGGERQRISIARVILRNPEIIILDESTSALDPITTSEVIKNLLDYYEKKTIIFTAHKLTSISEVCDNIYVFKNGQIVEQGTHKYLMDKNYIYKELYEAQFLKQA